MSSLLAQETIEEFAPLDTPDIEWSLMWPLVVLAVGGILLVTITSLVPVTRGRGFPAAFTAALSVTAMVFLPWMSDRVADSSTGRFTIVADALVVDGFTIFITAVVCVALFATALVLDDYLRREGLDGPEWYVLLLMSACGGIILASAEDLIVAFVGLEILSIAVYVLAALHLRRSDSQEAGFKYFILGALSSAIFLYGIAMVYGATGSVRLTPIARSLGRSNELGLTPAEDSSMILLGMALMLVGVGFKVSAAPFHTWTPDVYQGSPSPIVGFMASAVKVAGFAGFLRIFVIGLGDLSADWRPLVAAMAVLTLAVGAFMAVVQQNVKRMLAYSSMTHAGFMLIGLYVAGNADSEVSLLGTRSVLFYLLAYTVMVIGTFGVITVVGGRGDGDHNVADYRGLSQRKPVLAAMLAVLLFAQSGVPFTAGFLAKFRVITAAADDGSYALAGVAMLAAVVAAFLYLRLIVAMFLGSDDAEPAHEEAALATATEDGEAGEASEVDPADADTPAEDDELPPVVVPGAAWLVIGLSVIGTLVLGVAPDLVGDALRDGSEAISFLRP